jgi:zinc transporter 1
MQNPWQVFAVGAVGLLVNGIGVALFFSHRSLAVGHAHSHSHGHSHANAGEDDEDSHAEHHGGNVNMHGVFLHVAGDAVGALIVMASALVNIYVPYDWRVYFDPACSILFSLLILRSALPLIRQSVTILMQSAPKALSMAQLRRDLLQVPAVSGVHELHVWQMAPRYSVATVHLVVDEASATVVNQCNEIFCKRGIHRTTIQIDVEEE